MEFYVETEYTAQTLRALSHVLRKTVRRKQDLQNKAVGFILIVCAGVLTVLRISENGRPQLSTWMILAAALIVISEWIFSDRLSGWIAHRRMPANMAVMRAVLSEDVYTIDTDAGKTEWSYDRVGVCAETDAYFFLLLDQNHGQVFDKAKITGGDTDAFRAFLERKTGKTVQKVR